MVDFFVTVVRLAEQVDYFRKRAYFYLLERVVYAVFGIEVFRNGDFVNAVRNGGAEHFVEVKSRGGAKHTKRKIFALACGALFDYLFAVVVKGNVAVGVGLVAVEFTLCTERVAHLVEYAHKRQLADVAKRFGSGAARDGVGRYSGYRNEHRAENGDNAEQYAQNKSKYFHNETLLVFVQPRLRRVTLIVALRKRCILFAIVRHLAIEVYKHSCSCTV